MPGSCESGFQYLLDGWIISSFVGITERSDDMGLPFAGNLAVAGECCQDATA
jgi:hypothetical protein